MRPNRSDSALLAGLLAFLALPLAAVAQETVQPLGEELVNSPRVGGGGPTEGAAFLLLPVGARAVGMGGAVTGMRGSGDFLLWNPAGVAAVSSVSLLFNHSENAFDTRSDVLSLLWPLKSIGTLGLTYYLVDYGELSSTSAEGSVQGTINFRNQEFLFTYASRISSALELGLNYKIVQSVFRCDGICNSQQSFTRTTQAFDLGLIYSRPAGIPISLGASVRHLGFALKGATQEDPLPTRVRLGAAYHLLTPTTEGRPFGLALAMDVEDRWRDMGNPDVLLGTEFAVERLFFLRAGYSFLDSGLGGPSLGLGLTYDWFFLDLSRGFDDVTAATGEEAVQVTFGATF